MTKAERLYCGKGGSNYWKRNFPKLNQQADDRAMAIRNLLTHHDEDVKYETWVEVGCGLGHNLMPGDVGVDIDPRVFDGRKHFIGIVAHAYDIPLPDKSYDVAFSVGCLMHLASGVQGSWQQAAEEMARVARKYVILGEYISPKEKMIPWHGIDNVLWARRYAIPGFSLMSTTKPLPPFDTNLSFMVFQRD